MAGIGDFVQLKTISAESIQAGDYRITPRSQALTLRWPHGGLVYARPTAVLVERADERQYVPIVDVTRLVQVVLAVVAILGMLAMGLASWRSQQHAQEQ